ncbi:hypothetical protein H8356DRAFT_1317644 [Neocallimastix lanati (nom. inval.)]|nr:hypothetical protein H8356DRAFT_1317644 [Neocallimastix sp. JGI-2020a]
MCPCRYILLNYNPSDIYAFAKEASTRIFMSLIILTSLQKGKSGIGESLGEEVLENFSSNTMHVRVSMLNTPMLINLSLSTLLDKKLGEEKKLSDLKKNKENNYKKYLILFKEMNNWLIVAIRLNQVVKESFFQILNSTNF